MAVVELQHAQLKEVSTQFESKRTSLQKRVLENSKAFADLKSFLDQMSLDLQNNMEDVKEKCECYR